MAKDSPPILFWIIVIVFLGVVLLGLLDELIKLFAFFFTGPGIAVAIVFIVVWIINRMEK